MTESRQRGGERTPGRPHLLRRGGGDRPRQAGPRRHPAEPARVRRPRTRRDRRRQLHHIELWDAARFREKRPRRAPPRSTQARASTTSPSATGSGPRARIVLTSVGTPLRRARLQPLGRRGCLPLLRPLSAVADPGRHPGRRSADRGAGAGTGGRRLRRRRRGKEVADRRAQRWSVERGQEQDVEAEFSHLPVMPREVVELLLPVPTGLIVDCTVGGAGHAALLLDARPDVRLLGIDRDADAVVAARTPARALRLASACGARRIRGARRPGRRARRGEASDGDPDGSGCEQPAARPRRTRVLVPLRRSARHADGRQAGADRRRSS